MLWNTGTAAAATSYQFSDVTFNFWAYKYVAKLAALEIAEGDQEGKFNPELSVNHQEAVVMVLRFAGFEAAGPATGSLSLDVDEWAAGWVELAVANGFVVESEESGHGGWGERYATREGVTRLVVRAIFKEAAAAAYADRPVLFIDAAVTSPWAVGYINIATRLNIVHGFPDNTFRPLHEMTRAQLSKVLSSAELHAPDRPGKTVKGQFVSLDNGVLTLINDAGTQVQYNIAPDTLVPDSTYPAASFSFDSSQGDMLGSSSILTTGQVSRSGVIGVFAAPVTASLVNSSDYAVNIPDVPHKASLVVFRIHSDEVDDETGTFDPNIILMVKKA